MDGKQALSERRIAEKALEIIDSDGVEALTMRRLASALGVNPMAPYHYYPNKKALLEAATQLVLAEVDAPRESLGLDWKQTVQQIMRSVREVGLRHPHMVPLMESYSPRTLDSLAFVESGFRALRSAGFNDEAIVRHYMALAAYSFGTLATEVNHYFSRHSVVQQRAGALDAASMARLLPNLAQVGPALALQDPGQQFEWGLDLLLYGFERLNEVSPRG